MKDNKGKSIMTEADAREIRSCFANGVDFKKRMKYALASQMVLILKSA